MNTLIFELSYVLVFVKNDRLQQINRLVSIVLNRTVKSNVYLLQSVIKKLKNKC